MKNETPKEEAKNCCSKVGASDDFTVKQPFCSSPQVTDAVDGSLKVDLRGLQCPGPILRLKKALSEAQPGSRVTATASDPGFAHDLPAFCAANGHEVLSIRTEGRDIVATIRRGAEARTQDGAVTANGGDPRNATLIVFSNDLDKALASFIIANGARAMGGEVTLFFTFWGLNILRKAGPVTVRKGFIDRMFGWMMPRGAERLTLSKMHMMGMGTAMMKGVMKGKNVDSLPKLIETARAAGVRIVACSMSMDVMGIQREELIEGVEIGGVAQYLHEASKSGVNLFV